jgi:hypothetical protein
MNLKVKFLPYERLDSRSLDKILEDVRKDTIIMIDAKLSAKQEARIIEETMKKVSEKFSGIELGSLELVREKNAPAMQRFKGMFIDMVIGKRRGITVIGPARIIKKIKKNPEDLLLDMSG